MQAEALLTPDNPSKVPLREGLPASRPATLQGSVDENLAAPAEDAPSSLQPDPDSGSKKRRVVCDFFFSAEGPIQVDGQVDRLSPRVLERGARTQDRSYIYGGGSQARAESSWAYTY